MNEDKLLKRIDEVVDKRITQAIEPLKEQLNNLQKQTTTQGKQLDTLGKEARTRGKQLDRVEKQNVAQGGKLDKLEKQSGEQGEKIDILIAESHDTNLLLRGVHDIVKGRYEKNKREIDEIKEHLDMPLTPPFGD